MGAPLRGISCREAIGLKWFAFRADSWSGVIMSSCNSVMLLLFYYAEPVVEKSGET